MNHREKQALYLLVVSLVLGVALYTIYSKAESVGNQPVVYIITITNIFVFVIGAIATSRLLKQQEKYKEGTNQSAKK